MKNMSVVGAFPFSVAFQVVRDLEHAGIRTDLKRSEDKAADDQYVVSVEDQNTERALTYVS